MKSRNFSDLVTFLSYYYRTKLKQLRLADALGRVLA